MFQNSHYSNFSSIRKDIAGLKEWLQERALTVLVGVSSSPIIRCAMGFN